MSINGYIYLGGLSNSFIMTLSDSSPDPVSADDLYTNALSKSFTIQYTYLFSKSRVSPSTYCPLKYGNANMTWKYVK